MNSPEMMSLMRTAQEQFKLVGCNSILLTVNMANRMHYVDSTAGKCIMEAAEYEAYKALCAKGAETPIDLKDAPGVSMLEATAEEEAELAAFYAGAVKGEWVDLTKGLSAQMSVLGSRADVKEFAEMRLKPRSHFAAFFREIERLLLSYSHILCEEERDDLILNLAAKIMPLKEAVLRAEEIWSEGGTQL